tara:strand:- start:889 stop:1254 length:366 start_codon:yes stop_codon:yes gene_type:complete
MVTNKQKFNKKYNQKLNEPNSKKDISKLTGISMSILDKVYDRGLGAFKSNPGRRAISGPQWAMARIYSFAVGGRTQKTADADLWNKHLKKKSKKPSKPATHKMPDGTIMQGATHKSSKSSY